MTTTFVRRLRALPWDVEQASVRDRLATIYEAHVDHLFRCVRALGLSEAMAEDAVHDTFVIVHGKLDSFDDRGPGSLRAWLYGIALRVARRNRARAARETSDDALTERATDERHAPDALTERARLSARLLRLLEELDDAQREAFVLFELEELSAPEVARLTGANVSTVYSRVRLAREHLERALRRTRAREDAR